MIAITATTLQTYISGDPNFIRLSSEERPSSHEPDIAQIVVLPH